MSTSVPGVSTSSTGTAITGTTGTTLSNPTATQLNGKNFLDLMMTQLTHQDPTNPSDPSQYLSELAQMTSVEQETNTAQSTAASATAAAVNQAVGLIGHTVSYIDQSTGKTVSGAVQKVAITSSGPTLTIGGVTDISPSWVTEVS
jgi:flagellar basal-body rod modification protein FlgD